MEQPTEPILHLMSQQFDRMQQQMFQMQQQMSNQFHQMMMAMFQMFGTMHQDQMSRVQEELEQIHRLSEELKTLQERSTRGSSSGPDQRSSDLPTKPRSLGSDSSGKSPSRRASKGSGQEPKSKTAARSSPGQGRNHAEETPAFPLQNPTANAREAERKAAVTDDSLHDILSQRIEELQRERQSHWQRILNVVVGKS
jgi:hypothetical protein